jgi:hypothetical protein
VVEEAGLPSHLHLEQVEVEVAAEVRQVHQSLHQEVAGVA